jgi:lysophospholipase L1-like esterase
MSMRRSPALRIAPILLVGAALSISLAVPAAAAGPSSTLYIALGDSLAWGDGASVPAHTGYVPRLAGYFQGASHGGADEMINLGVGGTTTGELLAGQVQDAVALIADPDTDTRVVTISVGGNDLLDLVNDPTDQCVTAPDSMECQFALATALQGVATNMPQILLTLQAALAGDPGSEKIFVLLPYNAFLGTGNPLEAEIDQAMRGAVPGAQCGDFGLDDILACSATSLGAIVVDAYPLFAGRTFQLTHMGETFNVHPNDAGYEVIAKAHRVADRES